MSIILKPGTRLFGVACTTEIVVVKAPSASVALEVAGSAPVLDAQQRSGELIGPGDEESSLLLGKRYVTTDDSVEVLCTKAGPGPVTIDGEPLVRKDAKPLPSSD
jgi:hypothetical protein